MRVSRPSLIAAILLTVAILVRLCIMAPRMYPLQSATSAEFWNAITGVDLGAQTQRPALAVFDRDRFVFGSQYHFSVYGDLPYETISQTDVAAGFPAVRLALDARVALNNPDDFVAAGYATWTRATMYNQDAPLLVEFINEARRQWNDGRLPVHPPNSFATGEDAMLFPSASLLEFERGLKHVARASRFYWADFVFEAVYLPAVVWFVFWPYIRRYRLRRKLFHVAFFPFLVLLPYWFGYTNLASPAIPRGGILYPYVVFFGTFPRLNYLWEISFLSHFPPFLSVITQGRVVTFANYEDALASPYQAGPVNAAVISLVLTALVAACHLTPPFIRRYRERHRSAGFPVLNVGAAESPPR